MIAVVKYASEANKLVEDEFINIEDVAKIFVDVEFTEVKSVNIPVGAESTGTYIDPDRVKLEPEALMNVV